MIPVLDIFAGPGGLSEGFSSVRTKHGQPAFDVVLSIEKNEHAFQTLRLRAFFRQFSPATLPDDYYSYLRGEVALEELYARYPAQAKAAESRTWLAELGHKDTPARTVQERIDAAVGGRNVWVLIGGPPCQAYSIAGRTKNRSLRTYKPTMDVRQGLYVEYLKILANHWPAAFVMENVKGLLSAKLRNRRIFRRMLEDLQDPARALHREGKTTRRMGDHHYRIYSLVEQVKFTDGDLQNSVIRAEEYGIPQARHRIILVGVRSDLEKVVPGILKPHPLVSASRVLNGLPPLRSGLSRSADSADLWRNSLCGEIYSQWANAGAVHAGGEDVRQCLRRVLNAIRSPAHDRGAEFVAAEAPTNYANDWFYDPRLGGVCNHGTRSHMVSDLHRYLYAACYAQVHGQSPSLRNFPTRLLPAHVSARTALEEGGNFSDRFRVQVADRPATTVMSHIHKDGHYYIHPDPMQCRSLTVREAARLQTFPDNYFFVGPCTEQYIQVGNAGSPFGATCCSWRSALAG